MPSRRDLEFDRLVEQAFRKIPVRFRRRMENVVIVVEPEPPPSRVTGSTTLLGLYEGRPLTERGVGEPPRLPDRITIFQGPHERMARSRTHLIRALEDTLWHEVAHYFGMDEKRVRSAERRRAGERVRLSRESSSEPGDAR